MARMLLCCNVHTQHTWLWYIGTGGQSHAVWYSVVIWWYIGTGGQSHAVWYSVVIWWYIGTGGQSHAVWYYNYYTTTI